MFIAAAVMSFIGFFVSLLAIATINISALQNYSSNECSEAKKSSIQFLNLCPYSNQNYNYVLIGLGLASAFASLIFGFVLLLVMKQTKTLISPTSLQQATSIDSLNSAKSATTGNY